MSRNLTSSSLRSNRLLWTVVKKLLLSTSCFLSLTYLYRLVNVVLNAMEARIFLTPEQVADINAGLYSIDGYVD